MGLHTATAPCSAAHMVMARTASSHGRPDEVYSEDMRRDMVLVAGPAFGRIVRSDAAVVVAQAPSVAHILTPKTQSVGSCRRSTTVAGSPFYGAHV